jgi:hypothetical protein
MQSRDLTGWQTKPAYARGKLPDVWTLQVNTSIALAYGNQNEKDSIDGEEDDANVP